ncbi:MAG: DUF58 domain-containing protein [Elusimicrobia bacterium]|nr:DUF58 domain-containing protein [Elusimicrobiota bacterium]
MSELRQEIAERQKKIRAIEIRCNKLVNETFGGQYESVFKGKGMQFADLREYMPGDDIRTIDWNVTARQGKPYVKLFTEERELTVLFLIDLSASQHFGSVDILKSELSAEIASVIAFAAIKNNDRAGMLAFTDEVEKVITPRKGKNNILRIVSEILSFKAEGVKTSISTGLKAINEIWRKKALVFLISDFQDDSYEKDLIITAKHHDLVCINISDNREKNLPDIGIMDLRDPETGKNFMIDSSSSAAKGGVKSQREAFEAYTKRVFTNAKVDVINLNTHESYINPLIRFFKERQKRRGLG